MQRKLILSLIITGALITVYLLNPSFHSTDRKEAVVLGSDKMGTVEKLGPYGNRDSEVKIAYITGVHPLEGDSHRALLQALEENQDKLRYTYFVYRVNVTFNPEDYEKGRMAGQLLARRYVVPDVSRGNYSLAVDVHSNRGNYGMRRFVFTPLPHEQSRMIALKLASRISWLSYYFPESQTSPAYVTEPIIQGGIPAILYENYMYQDYPETLEHAREFVITLDSTDIPS
ncbi:hypothetical protein FVF72_08885 [Methanothermobacter sp. KEPCO-1]|uniref:hypothetical protein n=1 Tax=Methanothermobacter sp. KEPCO-1 TaxID=2603820 RepID=UPI0011C930D4|nr:hypothetical protein [Methanothermobacter sp. KEPCO-1]QEF95254.1 hypothetical protein FVF72_08885 [Methanothermobacter sp. KEPCO-1]